MKPPTHEQLKHLLNRVITIRNQMEDNREPRDPYIMGLYDVLQWAVNADDPPDLSDYEEEG